MKIFELTPELQIWTTNEEAKLLKKFKTPVKLNMLNAHDKFIAEYMIRKNLLKKSGFKDPIVVANEKPNKDY